jgi:serine/threonine protein kinase
VSVQGDATTIIKRQPLLAKRFEVVKVLGAGGASAVFHVIDTAREGAEVALKVLTNAAAFDGLMLSRFEAEVELLQSLEHPHIVRAYDFINLGHTVAYSMELVRGKELSRFLEPGSLDWDEMGRIFEQLLSALHELHARGVFHRDLKLENILYSSETGIKLADFGLMKVQGLSHHTQTGVLLGTAQYMAPEYIRSSKYDARSDMYGVGLLMYELCSGSRFLADLSGNQAINYLLERNFAVPRKLPVTVPLRFHRVIDKALRADPRRRYQSAFDMMAALQGTEGNADYVSSTQRLPRRTVVTSFGLDPALVLLLVVFLTICTALWFVLRHQ